LCIENQTQYGFVNEEMATPFLRLVLQKVSQRLVLTQNPEEF
jgi:hypothetical protein